MHRKKVTPKKNAGETSKIEVELVKLSLTSVKPVDIKGNLFDVDLKLDPKKKPAAKGKMKIKSHDDKKGGGEFLLSLFNTFVEITFTPVAGGQGAALSLDLGPMQSRGGRWSQHVSTCFL